MFRQAEMIISAFRENIFIWRPAAFGSQNEAIVVFLFTERDNCASTIAFSSRSRCVRPFSVNHRVSGNEFHRLAECSHGSIDSVGTVHMQMLDVSSEEIVRRIAYQWHAISHFSTQIAIQLTLECLHQFS